MVRKIEKTGLASSYQNDLMKEVRENIHQAARTSSVSWSRLFGVPKKVLDNVVLVLAAVVGRLPGQIQADDKRHPKLEFPHHLYQRVCLVAMVLNLAVPSHNPDPRIRLPIPGEHVINGERVFEKQVKQKTLNTLYELRLYDSEPIILHGIVCRGDFSQELIMVTNTGTEDFALLADIGRLTFCLCEEAALATSPCCVATSSMK
jgi:hypothetical protein